MKVYQLLDKADEYQHKFLKLVKRVYGMLKPTYLLLALFGLHWFSTSGAVYNMINSVGPYSVEKDANGNEHIQILAEGTHQQYSTEGFLAGLLTCAASAFFIMSLRTMHKENGSAQSIYTYLLMGLTCVFAIHVMYKMK